MHLAVSRQALFASRTYWRRRLWGYVTARNDRDAFSQAVERIAA